MPWQTAPSVPLMGWRTAPSTPQTALMAKLPTIATKQLVTTVASPTVLPVCTLDAEATDDLLNDPGDVPRDPDDLALLEQPASIPSTARLTPAHRRPRISLL